MILSVSNLKKSYGSDNILVDINFQVDKGEKAAIVGVNGAGKTTLFKILTGAESYDEGVVNIPKNTEIALLTQESSMDSQQTVYDELLGVFSHIIRLEEKMRDAESQMAFLTGDELKKAMDNYAALTHSFEMQGGYEYKSRLRGVINGLKLYEEDAENRKINTLSGGQKTRVALAKQLLANPEILLLDEPTNHLDIQSVTWLEEFLNDFNSTVLIISHDRYFIDKVANKIIDIEHGKSTVYSGSYQDFMLKKQLQKSIDEAHFENQQKNIAKQEESIKTLLSFNREKSVKRARSKQKSLEKIDRLEAPTADPKTMNLTLSPQIESGNDVLQIKSVKKSFGTKPLFNGLDLDIKKGDKIALLGANGIGKTTLLKIILGEISPDAGQIKPGGNVKIGYYEQERESLDENKTIFEEMKDTYPEIKDLEIRNTLAAFLFSGDAIFKNIGMLSGGEKGRLYLAKIMLSGANFLIMDEPTNHLDIYSKDILERAIISFEGTVLYVSHDRYFINRTANKTIELNESGLTTYFGNYDYYFQKKKELNLDIAKNTNAASVGSVQKEKWLENKQTQSENRKRLSDISKLEREIDKLENKIKSIEVLLDSPEVNTDPMKAQSAYAQKEEAEEKLMEIYEKWEELQS